MRTTITLADDTHEFATYYARMKGISLGSAIDELIRKAQAPPAEEPAFEIGPSGLPMFPPTPGRIITSELVKQIEEEEFDPKNFV